jgi:4-hydroxybenzoate polyprenyltransferase
VSSVKNYLSLIKFSHTIFAMPFAMIGFFLGITNVPVAIVPGWHAAIIAPWGSARILTKLILVVLCMVFARSAAMAFNRYLDRNFDANNPRTALREIPAGVLSASSTLWFVIICSFLFMVCCWFINRLCFFLSPVALFVVLGYSYTKRFTPLCHLILGLGLSLAPIGAYLAVTAQFDILPVIFSFTVLTWVSGFDIIYALQDEEFDRSQKLYSIPAAVGKANALRISKILHVSSVIFVVLAGLYGSLYGIFSWLYWIGVAVFTGMLIYQHSIVNPGDLRRVNVAFMTANGIASVVFAAFVIADLFIYF